MKDTRVRSLGLALAFLFVAWTTLAACGGDPGGGTASPSASVSPTPSASPLTETFEEHLNRAGKNNVVRVKNTDNGRFLARSSAVLDRIGGSTVDPQNEAYAEATCTDCQTIAVALQVAVYRRNAPVVTPTNVAVALNTKCTRCVTVALAYQYVIPSTDDDDDPEVPERVRRLIRELDRELKYFHQFERVSQIDTKEAERRLNAIVETYADLKTYLTIKRDEKKDDDRPSPSPSTSPSPATTPTATPGTTPAPTPTPTPTRTP